MRKLVGFVCDPKKSSIGLLGYVGVSIIFGERFDWRVAMFALVVPYLVLDVISFVLYIILRHGFGIKKLTSHWVLTHHPLLVVPIMGWLGWVFGGWIEMSSWYTAVLGSILTLAHFVDDSKYDVGLHWLSPFCWDRFSCAGGIFHLANPEMVKQNYERVENWDSGADVSERVAMSASRSQTHLQVYMFLFGIVSFILFLFQ